MNLQNIRTTIAILERLPTNNFNISAFQGKTSGRFLATTEAELHTCGNTACIAGALAVSPEWKALGGLIGKGGGPFLGPAPGMYSAADALSWFWELPVEKVSAIIYGDRWLEFVARFRLTGMPGAWWDLDKDQAISMFYQLLSNELGAVVR